MVNDHNDEYFNSSESMLDSLKQKFPDCSEAIEELKHLQHFTSLRDQVSKNSKFIQMAREVQKSSTDIGSHVYTSHPTQVAP